MYTIYRNRKETKGEVNSGEVITQPDMSIKVREMILNHTRGHKAINQGLIHGGEQIIFKDITELEEYMDQNVEKIKVLEEKLKPKENQKDLKED